MTLKCVVSTEHQQKHYPENFLVNGIAQPNPEKPVRIDMLLDGAKKAGMEIITPVNYGLGPILRIHNERYIDFLEYAYKRWSYIDGAADAVTPNIHPVERNGEYPASVVAQAGFHMTDASCPISADTWESALWSAWSAVHAAEMILNGDKTAYALCRPPGHHASADMAGGFCYLNNNAIATAHLMQKYKSIAILDVDLHHGNGTQSIFYHRSDVLTVSIHADPRRFYPFFWGYASETGDGAGAGYNLNFPLPRGSNDEAFLDALDSGLERIKEFSPDALVIALGLDAYEGDPFAGLAITTNGFHEIGNRIGAALDIPTVIIQEGGYPCDELGSNLAAFISGFENRLI
jgi:acetoin utilization deacetylase AcuC-like enzyme